MPSLSDLQRSFVAATLFGDDAALAALGVASGKAETAASIAIYRNNVFANYRRALAATFPVVRALVGASFFSAMVEAFVRAHPSRRGDVNRYGGELPRFLGGYAPSCRLPYLADVARLEWAMDQAAIASDADPIDLDALAAVPPERLGALRLRLHPSVSFLVSTYPILHIWRANQPGHEDERVDLAEAGDSLLVARGTDGVFAQRLGPGSDAFLRALAADADLTQALDRALIAEPSFDLGAALRTHVADGLIVGFFGPTRHPPENTP